MKKNHLRFIEIQDRLMNIYEITTIYKNTKFSTDLCFTFKNGSAINVEFDTEDERDAEFKQLKNILNDKCAHCGDGEAVYCEKCYQNLIAANTALQLENINLCNDINSRGYWPSNPLKRYEATSESEVKCDGNKKEDCSI